MSNIDLDKIENFLAGTFHQDINSIEEALSEYILEYGSKWAIEITNTLEEFLNSNVKNKDKFIEDNTEIYFEGMKIAPTKWLENIIEEMRQKIYN